MNLLALRTATALPWTGYAPSFRPFRVPTLAPRSPRLPQRLSAQRDRVTLAVRSFALHMADHSPLVLTAAIVAGLFVMTAALGVGMTGTL